MAQDPDVYEFCNLTATEELATAFVRERRLLLSDQALQQQQQCLLSTAGCNGTVHAATKRMRGKDYEGFRCTQCRKFRSAKNAIVQGEVRAATQANELQSFFATLAADGKSHTKISIKAALAVIYFWAKGILVVQTKAMVHRELGSKSNNTVIDWHNYIREVCERTLNEAPLMGGPGEIIQIDESLMRGR